VAFEFSDIYCEKILLQPEFMSLDSKLVSKLLKRDQLNAPEVSIFEALLRWGTKHADSDAKDRTEALANAVKDLLPLIRFPAMEMGDIAAKVAPTNLLTPDQMLAVRIQFTLAQYGIRPLSDCLLFSSVSCIHIWVHPRKMVVNYHGRVVHVSVVVRKLLLPCRDMMSHLYCDTTI
jgi:hypothetical protein